MARRPMVSFGTDRFNIVGVVDHKHTGKGCRRTGRKSTQHPVYATIADFVRDGKVKLNIAFWVPATKAG